MLSTAAKSRGATLDSGSIFDPEDRSNSWSGWPWFYDLESAALSGGWVGNTALPAGIDGGADRTATVETLGMETAVPSPAETSGNNGRVGTMPNAGEPSGGANREVEQSLQLTDSETEDRQPIRTQTDTALFPALSEGADNSSALGQIGGSGLASTTSSTGSANATYDQSSEAVGSSAATDASAPAPDDAVASTPTAATTSITSSADGDSTHPYVMDTSPTDALSSIPVGDPTNTGFIQFYLGPTQGLQYYQVYLHASNASGSFPAVGMYVKDPDRNLIHSTTGWSSQLYTGDTFIFNVSDSPSVASHQSGLYTVQLVLKDPLGQSANGALSAFYTLLDQANPLNLGSTTTLYLHAPTNLVADDYAGDTSTTGAVSVGGSTTGNIETSGDTDWFRITLTAGQVYTFDLQGNDSGQGTLSNPFLRLRDSGGVSITSDDDGGSGSDSQIAYTPTSSGTYYLSGIIELTYHDTAGRFRTVLRT